MVGVAQPGVSLALEGCELACYVREVFNDVLCGVCVVSWLALDLRVRTSREVRKRQNRYDVSCKLCSMRIGIHPRAGSEFEPDRESV